MQTTTTVNSMTAVFNNTPTRSAQVGGQRATELTTGHTFRGDVKSRRSTRSFMLDLLVAACMIATVSGQSAGASFNFEISKRTEAAVRTFMQPPVLVNQMSENGYRVGAVSIDNNPSVRKWEFSMMISFDTLYMVYAGFEMGSSLAILKLATTLVIQPTSTRNVNVATTMLLAVFASIGGLILRLVLPTRMDLVSFAIARMIFVAAHSTKKLKRPVKSFGVPFMRSFRLMN